MSILVIEVEVV